MEVGGQRHDPHALFPAKRPNIHYKVGWVGTNAGLGGAESLAPHRDSIPGPSSQ
jgi:hypothetical protein